MGAEGSLDCGDLAPLSDVSACRRQDGHSPITADHQRSTYATQSCVLTRLQCRDREQVQRRRQAAMAESGAGSPQSKAFGP